MGFLRGHMNIQIAVALIAAISALGVACMQYFSQRKTLRSVEELKAKLETEKTRQSEYFKAYLTLVLDGKTQQLSAFKSVLEHVQLLRDRMRNFASDPQAYSRELIGKEVREHADKVMEAYSANQMYFDAMTRKILHDVKNHCRRIEVVFERYGRPGDEPGQTNLVAQEVVRAESVLAELQTLLRTEAHKANAAFLESLKNEAGQHAVV
jgi:hypothetical protein